MLSYLRTLIYPKQDKFEHDTHILFVVSTLPTQYSYVSLKAFPAISHIKFRDLTPAFQQALKDIASCSSTRTVNFDLHGDRVFEDIRQKHDSLFILNKTVRDEYKKFEMSSLPAFPLKVDFVVNIFD